MRVLAIACLVVASTHGAQARDVALTLDWPSENMPAVEIVSVARDMAGKVLDLQRLGVPDGTREAVLPLPSLSRQASTVQVGALLEGEIVLQSQRAPAEGGQPPDVISLNAALSASFSSDYYCGSGREIGLLRDGDGLRLLDQRFAPTALDTRFTAADGTTLNRAPGIVQLESPEGALLDSCQPIPARPILPLDALGTGGAWALRTGLAGTALRVGPLDPAAAVPEPVVTTIARQGDDSFVLSLGTHELVLRNTPCQLPGLDMPYPYSARLSAPETSYPAGCAGDPLRALEGVAWQVTHLFGYPAARNAEGGNAFTLQIDTGRITGRTSCNRFLGLAEVREGRLAISGLGTTRLTCPANLSNLQTRFLDALEAADGIVMLPKDQVALYAGSTAVLILGR